MTEIRSLSSAPEACLERAYSSSQKGGTIIAEEVQDLQTHEQYLEDPDRYRPQSCRRCGAKVHVHDLRPRLLLADPARATEVMRFRCADRENCGAAWEIVPGFLARHLWRSWRTVARALEQPERSEVPKRTRCRWQARLARSARQLIAVLTTATEKTWWALAAAAGLDASRFDLVADYRARIQPERGRCFAQLAGLVHRLAPGVRLM